MKHAGSMVASPFARHIDADVHVCHFFRTADELAEPVLPYFRAGLDHGEHCLWVTAEPLGVEDARSFMRAAVPDLKALERKGQIEFLDSRELYATKGKPTAERTLRAWIKRGEAAMSAGWRGFRVVGNASAAEREDWDDFGADEARVTEVFQAYGMRAICSYHLDGLTAEDVGRLMAHHEASLLKREGVWDRLTLPGEQTVRSNRYPRTDLAAIARDVALELVDRFADADVSLRVRADEPIRGHWNEASLRRIITELLRNAVKHGNGLEVELDVLSVGRRAILAVRDRGPGLGDADLARSGPGLSKNGLQVGLWYTRRLVQSLGGSFRVASVDRGGSTVLVVLPH